MHQNGKPSREEEDRIASSAGGSRGTGTEREEHEQKEGDRGKRVDLGLDRDSPDDGRSRVERGGEPRAERSKAHASREEVEQSRANGSEDGRKNVDAQRDGPPGKHR